MSKYKFRGCEVYSIGYYEPEHRVVWEAVDEKTHEAVAHGYSMREVMMIILENQLREEYETKIRKLEDEIESLKEGDMIYA